MQLPTVIVLASGRGERFVASGGGSHKLQAMLCGKPALQHTLDAVRASGAPWRLEDGGHPVRFAARLRAALMALTGDRGAGQIARAAVSMG